MYRVKPRKEMERPCGELAAAQPARTAEIEADRNRLSGAGEMGELFKVVAIHSPDWPAPVGFGK
ncbi:MAG: hypothetical protein KY442_11770 [Proteobacteria bacterium]|nr:hypothetical protein [Pseudomonadota bacterium]